MKVDSRPAPLQEMQLPMQMQPVVQHQYQYQHQHQDQDQDRDQDQGQHAHVNTSQQSPTSLSSRNTSRSSSSVVTVKGADLLSLSLSSSSSSLRDAATTTNTSTSANPEAASKPPTHTPPEPHRLLSQPHPQPPLPPPPTPPPQPLLDGAPVRPTAQQMELLLFRTAPTLQTQTSIAGSSPILDLRSTVTAAPPLSLPRSPPLLLPATVYDPNSPITDSTIISPLTAGLYTPSLLNDYFSSKHLSPYPATQRPPSRSKAEKLLRKSPLASPAIIGLQEGDVRHATTAAATRSPKARRPSVPTSRDTAQKSSQTVGHRPATFNDHTRSQSKDHHRGSSRDRKSASKDHNRGESNTSARLDDNYQGTSPRTRERREKDKKTMLSRALQKANTAVLLDNAQNFEGAVEAYEDACKLLQHVMIRSSQDEDRRKLDAIRVTYTNRIEELRRLDPGYSNGTGKSLPARPMSGESLEEQRSMLLIDDDAHPVVQTATITRIVNDRSIDDPPYKVEPEPPPPSQLPLRRPETGPRESVISTAIRDVERGMDPAPFYLRPPPGRLAHETTSSGNPGVEYPMDRTYMPPPLSPNRPKSPLFHLEPVAQNKRLQPQQPTQAKHQRVHSSESTSWLDTIDESGGSSCSSSIHSMSPGGVRRKHIRSASGATEAEFDAALDAAVEAAYDEGYEPFDDGEPDDLMATRMRNVELAKERVREVEREEAIAAAKYRYKETQLRNEALPHVRETAELGFNDEADEEERLLDEMTEYMLDGFDFDLQTKSSLPRQSDSSGFSGSTYHSSVSSHRTTGGTSLSTVAEVLQPRIPKAAPSHSPPAIPAPSVALPPVPEAQTVQIDDPAEATPRPTTATKDAASVRSRRLSGQNAKTLKIETSLPSVPAGPHTEKPAVPAKDSPLPIPAPPRSAVAATFSTTTTQPTPDSVFKIPALPQSSQPAGLAAPSQQAPFHNPVEITTPATPALSHAVSVESGLVPGSPKTGKTSAIGIRKNKSSLSLKQRTLSISSPDGSDVSIGTPLSQTFSISGARIPGTAGLPLATPSIPTFNVDGLPSGGMHLFESDIHSPFSPGSPSPAVPNAPIPLEPCPDSYLLRPFWLMRCFYQTIAHPRGGYLSTKLFIPRDVWRVKGVKLKNIEDKIANCDLLTAALQKLATVDTLDADAMLEEMQALEIVLDQVQTQLAKKLGNEVGVHTVSTLFKDAYTVGEGAATDGLTRVNTQDHQPRSAVAHGKSYLTSWRKLRSKNSGVNLASMASSKSEVPKDSLTMATLPMTSLHTIRFAKRDISSVHFEGPNSGYMGSLARLFDAVQILDQIARQVEDPGLKHSSPTHVGLELSARHAAEFFGFYICRFVLTDVTMMLDKFIKRGSEWVLV
ncbi:hypothetical protein GQ44DRAFT_773126 [Phaeosphaeriaceae sp. PMI808]|nr:hypothetical protein GQ44DRAFT_773126 [Phaeosphaeriaceae sp. PMI808]